MIKSLSHVSIVVPSLDAAAKRLLDTYGLKIGHISVNQQQGVRMAYVDLGNARIELMEILRELRRMGKTVFISSHILSELAELCDSVTIIDRGQIKFSGPMDVLLESPDELPTYNLRLAAVYDNVIARIRELPGVDDVKEPEFTTGRDFNIQLASSLSANDFLKSLLTLDLPISSFSQQRRHLNQAFMDLTTRGVRT